MEPRWLVLGICGVTCGGKTTLAKECIELLPEIKIISQDDYFLPRDSPKHTYIPELNHLNWEILTSLDMEKMYSDIKKIIGNNTININTSDILKQVYIENTSELSVSKEELHAIKNKLYDLSVKILLIEGFSIFNYPPIAKLCHLKFYLTLSREVCYERRSNRVYDPPDVPGYFDKIVWPEHIRQLKEVQKEVKNVVYLPENNTEKCNIVFRYLLQLCKTLF